MSVGSALVPAIVGGALALAGMISLPPLSSPTWLPGSAVLAVILLVANAALQYGAPRLPTRVTAIVMLTEVPVAALSSVLIGGETLRPQVLAGGALIVLSSLAAALSMRSRGN
jgi:drug/metabolite transporter (DMT)-like permease